MPRLPVRHGLNSTSLLQFEVPVRRVAVSSRGQDTWFSATGPGFDSPYRYHVFIDSFSTTALRSVAGLFSCTTSTRSGAGLPQRELREVVAQVAAVAGKEPIRMQQRMRPDQEVWQHAACSSASRDVPRKVLAGECGTLPG